MEIQLALTNISIMMSVPQTQASPSGAASTARHSETRGLVFDIGMNNGDDSAYYLHLGYSVVGIDANPLLTSKCAFRFRSEVADGRMKIVTRGILRQPGEFTFYRNLEDDGWSSFDPARGKNGDKWEAIAVPCVTLEQLIAQQGKPYFMKIDIEGADFQAIESLTPASAPSYVSLELSPDDPILERLIDLGYTDFKFVDGESFRPAPPIFHHEIGWRLLRKMGRTAPVIRTAIRKLPESLRAKSEFNPAGKHSPDGYSFTTLSSGPFGEQAAGRWLDPKAALRWFGRLKQDYLRANETLWWDVHARHSSASRTGS